VRKADLEDEVFRIDFEPPSLLIKKNLGDWKEIARSPAFISLVYPSAFREIVTRIRHIEKYHEIDVEEDWRSRWLRYATLLPNVPEPSADDDSDRIDDWIENAVQAFCRHHRMIERFSASWNKED